MEPYVVGSADLTPEQVAAFKAAWQKLYVGPQRRDGPVHVDVAAPDGKGGLIVPEWFAANPLLSPFVTLEPRDDADEPHVAEGGQ